MLRQFLHARLIAEDTALGALARGVDGEYGQATAFLAEHMDAKLVDTGGFACTRHTTDTYADAVAAIGQTLVDDLLRLGLMVGVDTLDEGDGL